MGGGRGRLWGTENLWGGGVDYGVPPKAENFFWFFPPPKAENFLAFITDGGCQIFCLLLQGEYPIITSSYRVPPEVANFFGFFNSHRREKFLAFITGGVDIYYREVRFV